MADEEELKKRIDFVFNKPRYTPPEMVEDLKEMRKDFHKIADEIKKDWNAIWQWYHTNYARLTFPSNENILQTKLEEFGKKWFGDAE